MQSDSLYQDEPTPAAADNASVVEDLVDIFYAPTKVFERRREGKFGLLLLLLVVIVAALMFATRAVMEPVYDATWEQQMRAAMAKNPQMTPEMVEGMRSFGTFMMGFGFVLMTPILVLGTALVLFFVARLFDLKPTFTQAATIATLANIPRFVLSSIVTAAQAFVLVSPESPKTVYQLTLSPARFLPADASANLVAGLVRVELFTLWATILLGLGLAVVCRAPKKTGYLAAATIWFVATLVSVAFASAG